MTLSSKIALLPLDDRPVSYILPNQIASFSGIDLKIPDREHLANLQKPADQRFLSDWLNSLNQPCDLVAALDTWIYGGLVQSRRHEETLDILKSRVKEFISACKSTPYAFSSILRIPNYNNSDEEKDYWQEYGKKIFYWSELMHRVGRGETLDNETNDELLEKWYAATQEIPKEIIADFKSLRDKNMTINLEWLNLQVENGFKYLLFSVDDSSRYGLNIVEKEYLEKEIKKRNLNACTVSGTDEIPLVLMTRIKIEKSKLKPKIAIVYDSDTEGRIVSKYESGLIKDSIENQLKVLSIDIVSQNQADLVLIVHTSDIEQGDHIFNYEQLDTGVNSEKLIKGIEKINNPFLILDVAYANGADPVLITKLLDFKLDLNLFYGYAGWNTTSNSTGSLLAIGINRWISEKEGSFNMINFKKCLLVRFLDDYAFQTQIRHKGITEEELNVKMKEYISTFLKLLELKDVDVKCSLPWKRSFEVEINVL